MKKIHYDLTNNCFQTTWIEVKNDLILADISKDRENIKKSIEIVEAVEQKQFLGLHTVYTRDKVNFITKEFILTLDQLKSSCLKLLIKARYIKLLL